MRAVLLLRLMKFKEEGKMVAFMTGLTLIMIAVFSSVNYTERVVDLAYVDQDSSEMSHMLFEKMNTIEGYHFEAMTIEEAEKAVKKDDVEGAFIIRNNFMSDALNGSVTVDRLLISENMDNMQMNSVLQGSLTQVLMDYQIISSLEMVISPFSTSDISRDLQEMIDEHWTYKRPVSVSTTTLTESTPYSAIKHSIVGFSLFFAMFTLVFGISDILTDKENHTWQRQLVSPLPKLTLLSGNLIATFIQGFVQVTVMFVASKYLFKVDWAGQMLHAIIVVAAFVFCVTSMGMFLSNFVNTIGQLSAVAPVIITGTAMLGGCFWPLEIVTAKPLLLLSLITPQRWAINGIEKILVYDYGFEAIVLPTLILLAMGVVYLSLATYLLEKKAV